jgi:lipid-A-disaccharide synthase
VAAVRIGILAGESSGDILGAGLMQALREQVATVRFEGIGGPLMEAQGLKSEVPMERLSVMGLVEPLRRLPELLGIRRRLVQHFLANPPDVFIGIESPDFTLGIEERLRARGIKTVHYVSPSVWAWRQGRIRKIVRAVDLMLTLFPFEAAFYPQHPLRVECVGHPLADLIPLQPDRPAARAALGLPPQAKVLAVLPGSRLGEVQRLASVFLAAAARLLQQQPDLVILLPCATAAGQRLVQGLPEAQALLARGQLRISCGDSREVMTAADAVLLASGTAALEALLLKLPMLVCYRMAPLSYAIISRLLKVPFFSLPNLLAGDALVEELVQQQVQATALADKLQVLLAGGASAALQQRYLALHQELRRDASRRAAMAVLSLI